MSVEVKKQECAMCYEPVIAGKETCGSLSCQNSYASTKKVGSLMKPKDHWLSQVYDGRYQLVDEGLPKWFGPKSNIRVRLISDAGHVRDLNWRVLYYAAKSFIHPEKGSDLVGRKFGDLVVTGAPEWYYASSSRTMIKVRCKCGNDVEKQIAWLISGDTKTCGGCGHKTWEEWWATKYHRLTLVSPSHSKRNQEFIEKAAGARFGPGFNAKSGVDVLCDCGKHNMSSFYEVTTYKTYSCGCALNENTSGPERDLDAFVRSLGVETITQHRVAKHRLIDVFIPSLNLGIEHHGCHWHSEARRSPESRLKDYEKMVECHQLGIELIQVYGDEWANKRLIFEDMIRKRVGIRGRRVTKLTCGTIQKRECDLFLDANHYIGRADGSIRIGVFSKGILVGVAVIKDHASHLECTRFCMALGIRSYQPFAKVIQWLSRHSGKTLVSFSDNRLHTGNSYASYGFTKVADLPPDYCYTNGVRRSHKFNFRVPAGSDEQLEAAKLNYHRLWDSGKKKWELVL